MVDILTPLEEQEIKFALIRRDPVPADLVDKLMDSLDEVRDTCDIEEGSREVLDWLLEKFKRVERKKGAGHKWVCQLPEWNPHQRIKELISDLMDSENDFA